MLPNLTSVITNNTYTMRRRDLIAGYPQTLVPATGDMLITAGMSFKTLPFVRQLSTPCAAHRVHPIACFSGRIMAQ